MAQGDGSFDFMEWLTGRYQFIDTTGTVFMPHEREQVQLKALEQAIRAAHLARTDPTVLLSHPQADWPFQLSEDDRAFLKVNKISPA